MQAPVKSFMNWSGGKDSSLCLYNLLNDPLYNVGCLLTNMSSTFNRISMHGVRRELLEAQASAIGLPLQTIELPEQPGMAEYEAAMTLKVHQLKLEGYERAIFGDIFLEDLKKYREEKLAGEGMACSFPLWRKDTRMLMNDFISLGFKAIVVCVNEQFLDKDFCGRLLDECFINDLPPTVDPCGENGEYHTFVFDGPLFREPVRFTKGDIVRRTYPPPSTSGHAGDKMDRPSEYGFYFCDLLHQ
jgi:uncharacterized protein (TIGR00290 family)